MKKIQSVFMIFSALFISLQTKAQESEPALARVTYQFIHVYDTSNRDNPVKEDMNLYLGQNSSKYVSDILDFKPKPVNAPVAGASGGGNTVVVKAIPTAIVYGWGVTQETLFQHVAESKLNKVTALSTVGYLIELPLPKINWKVDQETRNIGGYTCQKATGDYAGRTYTAWFTPDLPFRNGPWKLSGLPGLILEASDAKKEVVFLFKEISRDTVNQNTGTWRTKLVKADEKAFNRARETYLDDPVGVSSSQRPAGDKPPMLIYRDAATKPVFGDKALELYEKYRKEMRAHFNNPLELIKQ